MTTVTEQEVYDAEPIESTSTELARIMAEGDPKAQLAILEEKAELAPRWNKALNTILITQTYPEDWTEQDGKVCLSSAGAERVARLFSIRFHDQKVHKEEFSDAAGSGYRYVYECTASMGNREIFAQGAYSTRDKFLGYAGGEWRPQEDINENNIRNAAYHICIGNAIKALLGLRGIPAARFKEIMSSGGQDASKASSVRRGAGTKGGTTADDSSQQKELAETCIYIANGGFTVEQDAKGKWKAIPMSDNDERSEIDRAKEICEHLSSFEGNEGNIVKGLPASKLKGKRLEITLKKSKEIKKEVDKNADAGAFY